MMIVHTIAEFAQSYIAQARSSGRSSPSFFSQSVHGARDSSPRIGPLPGKIPIPRSASSAERRGERGQRTENASPDGWSLSHGSRACPKCDASTIIPGHATNTEAITTAFLPNSTGHRRNAGVSLNPLPCLLLMRPRLVESGAKQLLANIETFGDEMTKQR